MKKNARISMVGNTDNADLEPMCGNGFVIGSVDEVNGDGAKEILGFAPTQHELIQVVKYWVNRELDIRWFTFITGQTGSTERRVVHFALRRIGRIGDVLGAEDVDKAIEEAAEEFSKPLDQHLLQVFWKGDAAEWETVQEETWKKINSEQKSTS